MLCLAYLGEHKVHVDPGGGEHGDRQYVEGQAVGVGAAQKEGAQDEEQQRGCRAGEEGRDEPGHDDGHDALVSAAVKGWAAGGPERHIQVFSHATTTGTSHVLLARHLKEEWQRRGNTAQASSMGHLLVLCGTVRMEGERPGYDRVEVRGNYEAVLTQYNLH